MVFSVFLSLFTSSGATNLTRTATISQATQNETDHYKIVKQKLDNRYTTFYVTDSDGNKVFSPMKRWQTSSIKKIAFMSKHTIVVITSDHGKTEYSNKNGTWIRK